MPYRWTHLRISNYPLETGPIYTPLSLWWPAIAAASETLQGAPFVSSWLNLFSAHLSQTNTTQLQWGEDLAASAEMRRAYSAMYGRFFARALLQSRLGLTDFVSLGRNGIILPSGVQVEKISTGDIPDWIAWDGQAGVYVLGEAKGSLTGSSSDFMHGIPKCILSGKDQFQRVQVVDANGNLLRTRNWVVANLWSTDSRPRPSVSLLFDPETGGRDLKPDEVDYHARSLRQARNLKITEPFRRRPMDVLDPEELISVSVSIEQSEIPAMPDNLFRDSQSRIGQLPIERPKYGSHHDQYLAFAVTNMGIRPIIEVADFNYLMNLKNSVENSGQALLFGLSKKSISGHLPNRDLWLSSDGIASPDGISLFDLASKRLTIGL